MVLDRRTLLLAAGSSLLVACSGRAEENVIDATSSGTDQRRRTARPATRVDARRMGMIWADFKTRFVQPDGRVIDTGNNGVSHTEGQGYAMVMAATAGDRAAFDSIFAWTEEKLAREQDPLFSWRYDPRAAPPVNDPNNATDGDMLIAWGLMLGADRWKERHLSERAAAIRNALHETMLRRVGGQVFLLPGGAGFEKDGVLTLNPSYYVWPALQRFQAADGDARWGDVLRGGQALIAGARFGTHKLPTDWVDLTAGGGFVPAAGRPPRFSFDAIRVPLYLAMVGQGGRADNVASFWRSYGDRPIPAWIDVQTGETAPYPLSGGGVAVARRLLGQSLSDPTPQPDYYATVLQALSHM